MAIEMRVKDVMERRDKKVKERKLRDDFISKESKRIDKRDAIVDKNLAAALKIYEKEKSAARKKASADGSGADEE